jgi:hypothetical protein
MKGTRIVKYHISGGLLILLLLLNCSGQVPAADSARQIRDMSNRQIDSLLTVTANKNLTITQRINFYSQMFQDMPYSLTCSGDGPYALYEPQPLVNFQETNCMVFIEHVLALSISDSWDNFFNNLQHIRYQDGIIGLRSRNHYTMADWLPENRWLLEDVSREVGGEYVRQVTRTISHQKFLLAKGVTDLRYVKGDREITIDYIPLENLRDIKEKLETGDIGSLIFAGKTDIFSAHMFLLAEKDGFLVVRESSNSKMKTFDTVYDEWRGKITGSSRYIGIAVMRIREELNQPGKIILPWEITGIKQVLDHQDYR